MLQHSITVAVVILTLLFAGGIMRYAIIVDFLNITFSRGLGNFLVPFWLKDLQGIYNFSPRSPMSRFQSQRIKHQ